MMTPLQRYLLEVRSASSGEKMVRRAYDNGYEISDSWISQIIRKKEPKRLGWTTLYTLAAACGVDVEVIKALEDKGMPGPEEAKRAPRTG